MKLRRHDGSLWIYVGPWAGRLIYERDRGLGFGWLEGQNALIRLLRKRWSGFHRWDDELYD